MSKNTHSKDSAEHGFSGDSAAQPDPRRTMVLDPLDLLRLKLARAEVRESDAVVRGIQVTAENLSLRLVQEQAVLRERNKALVKIQKDILNRYEMSDAATVDEVTGVVTDPGVPVAPGPTQATPN